MDDITDREKEMLLAFRKLPKRNQETIEGFIFYLLRNDRKIRKEQFKTIDERKDS